MSKRVLFTLTMPGVGSWNGRWSGEDKNFNLVRPLTQDERETAGIVEGEGSWSYAWDDGWRAAIHARVMEKGERRPKSDGFCGYEWMVDNIARWGSPRCRHEWVEDAHWSERNDEPWEKCRYCNRSRAVRGAA